MDEILELYRKDMDTSTVRQQQSGGDVTVEDTGILVHTSQHNRVEILVKYHSLLIWWVNVPQGFKLYILFIA